MFSTTEYTLITIPHMSGIASLLQMTTGYTLLDKSGILLSDAIEVVSMLFQFLDERGVISVKISPQNQFLIKSLYGS